MTEWCDYMAGKDPHQHTVVGNLKVLADCYSPQLSNRRDILAYLPPSYAWSDRQYPVIYMHDGQNLFDAATSFAGEWQVDETMEGIAGEGTEAIIVGIPNMGVERVNELSPFVKVGESRGRGNLYLSFIAETVKPVVDQSFRTLPERRYTGLIGSSLGGLISLYGYMQHSDVFGLAGVLSPALVYGDAAILPSIDRLPSLPRGRLYMDVGTHEGVNLDDNPQRASEISASYLKYTRALATLIIQKGYRLGGELVYVEDRGGIHHESAWAQRLPDALRFLLG